MTYSPDKHREELFFLDNFNVDRVFNTIQRADYVILYYIQSRKEAAPDEKVYLAALAEAMHLSVNQLSKAVGKLQDKGYVIWQTDDEAGRTYVELTSRATELMAAERSWIKRCYEDIRTEIGDEELARTAQNLQRIATILRENKDSAAVQEEQ